MQTEAKKHKENLAVYGKNNYQSAKRVAMCFGMYKKSRVMLITISFVCVVVIRFEELMNYDRRNVY